MSISRNQNLTDSVQTLWRTIQMYVCREEQISGGSQMTTNQIAYWNLQEEHRANKAKEDENVRSHKASEFISSVNAATNRKDANTRRAELGIKQQEADTKSAAQKEQKRHNVTGEVISGITGGLNSISNVANTIGGLFNGKR